MNINVSLPGELADYVEAKVSAGHYASSSEVVQEALRLLRHVEKRDSETLADLRDAWHEGLHSGEAEELNFAQLKEEGRARLAASKA